MTMKFGTKFGGEWRSEGFRGKDVARVCASISRCR